MKKGKLFISLAMVFCLGLMVVACSGGDKPEKDKTPVVKKDTPAPDSGDKGSMGGDKGNSDVPAGEITSFHYIMKIDAGAEGKMEMDYKYDEGRMNMKMTLDEEGKSQVMQIIADGDNMYMLEPTTKTGTKMPVDKDQLDSAVPKDMLVMPKWDQFKEENLKGGNIEKEGSEEVNGVDTTKYKVTGLEGSDHAEVYVDGDDILRRVVGYDAEGKQQVSMDFIKVDLSPDFTDADFSAPSGYEINDLSEMMKNMPKDMPDMPNMP